MLCHANCVMVPILYWQIQENKEDLKLKLKDLLHQKSDLYNGDSPEEDKVVTCNINMHHMSTCIFICFFSA